MLAYSHGVEDDIGLTLVGLTLVVEDVLIVGIATGIELRVVVLSAEGESKGTIFILGIGSGAETAIAALAYGSNQ